MALTGGFLWALYSVLLKKWKIHGDQGGTTLHFLICSLMAAALAAVRGEWSSLRTFTPEALFWILFGALGPVGSAYYFWELGIKKGSVNLAAVLSYFIPVGSTVIIGLIFRQAMSPRLIPGAVLIAAGSWLVRLAVKRKKGTDSRKPDPVNQSES
jgi:drug/metabolite transporter (DMT)-like permease